MGARIVSHFDLDVHCKAFEAAMTLFHASKAFPKEERYALTDQVRRSARSVAANIAEAWRKRRYEAAFVAKLNDAEAGAAETQDWIAFAVRCEYLPRDIGVELHNRYEEILRMVVAMANRPEVWVLTPV